MTRHDKMSFAITSIKYQIVITPIFITDKIAETKYPEKLKRLGQINRMLFAFILIGIFLVMFRIGQFILNLKSSI